MNASKHGATRMEILLAIGVFAAWIALQAFVNIGSMTGILPMTGVTLPFVSYGGTSLAVTMSAVGVILSVSKGKRRVRR